MNTSAAALDQNQAALERVLSSYERCIAIPTFFDYFYAALLGMSPTVREKFRHTDMPKQKKILQDSVFYLLRYYSNPGTLTIQKVSELGESHAADRLDIPPYLYGFWFSALTMAIGSHDMHFNAELERAWEMMLDHGISAFKAFYA